MRGIGFALVASIAALCTSIEARAETGVDRFEPVRDEQLLGLAGVDISTGWTPPSSAIQVSFDLHVEDDVYAELPGDALYDWAGETIHFEGDEGAGIFEIDVGVLVDARLRFDLLGNQFESELLGPYDLLALADVEFDPYLLPGNDHRPAHVLHTTQPSEVFSEPLVDALIASGEFVLDAAVDIDVALECTEIEVTPSAPEESVAFVQQEFAAVSLTAPADGIDQTATARLRCQTRSTVAVLLYPSVRVTLGLDEFELAPFELPVPVLTDDVQDFDFDPLDLTIPAPEAPSGSSMGGDDAGTASGTGSGTTGSDPSEPAAESVTGGPDSGTDGDGEASPSPGSSGCRVEPGPFAPREAWPWIGLSFAVLSVTRRNRVRSS